MIERVEAVGYGRPASEALAAALRRAKAGRPLAPVTVVAPTNFAALTARRLLGAGRLGGVGGGGMGIANVSFVTPFRLAELLGADQLLERRPLTAPVLGAAVRLALAEGGHPYAAVAGHHATEAALAELYGELSGASEASLEAIARSGPPGAAAVALHRRIAAHLGAFHDEAALSAAAAARVDLAARAAELGPLVWHLPAPLSAPLAALLRAVFAVAPTTVILGVAGHEEADSAVFAACRRVGVEPPGAGPLTGAPLGDAILTATDADEEVRAVVRRVLALAADGVPFERIGVFHPVADPYVGLLEQQLAAAGIPANGPARRPLRDRAAGRALLAALALPGQRWRRDRVLALASGGPLRSNGAPVRAGAWERLSREAGVVQDLTDWAAKLGRLAARRAERAAAGRELDELRALGGFVERLARLVQEVEAAAGWPAKAAAASALLVELLGPSGSHAAWPDAEQQAFDQVEEALARLAALGELEADPSHEVFVRALTAELDGTGGRVGRFGHGVVYGPLSSAPGHDLDAVFVLGCTEGQAPAPRRDDAVLADAVRRLAGGELALRAERLHEQHRWFLGALAAAPPGRRVLSAPRGDLRGSRSLLASRWLLDTAGALAGRVVPATELAELDAPGVEHVASFTAGLVGAAVHATIEERDLACLAEWAAAGGRPAEHPLAPLAGRGLAALAARSSAQLTEWDGNLTGRPPAPLAGRLLSATQLETWARCGYRYFLAYVLGLAERDNPEEVVDLAPLDRGAALHLVLERFFAEALPAPPPPGEPWPPEARRRVAELADEVFADYEARGRTGRAVHWRLTRADLHALLEEFLAADDAHRAATRSRPVRVELPFGLGGEAPVTLEVGGRRLAFRGRADRVDRSDDGRLLVSDYKTGKGKAYERLDEGDPVRAGQTLQLGLYAYAAADQLGGAAVEAHYWMVDPAAAFARHGYAWTPERADRFLEVVAAVAEGIERGVFPAEPGEWNTYRGTHDNCTYCEFDPVCGRERGEQAAAKAHAPERSVRAGLDWSTA
ncbi:MAG: PD-(D/E)XK nuclease family protein [Acidimicrobiales bacterium]